jgi:hypothetical protein
MYAGLAGAAFNALGKQLQTSLPPPVAAVIGLRMAVDALGAERGITVVTEAMVDTAVAQMDPAVGALAAPQIRATASESVRAFLEADQEDESNQHAHAPPLGTLPGQYL